MRESYDGSHKNEVKTESQIREEAIEALQREMGEEVSEEELEETLRTLNYETPISPIFILQ